MVDCFDCGVCCRVFGVVEVTAGDVRVPVEFTEETELGYRRMRTVGFACVCLGVGNRCLIYGCRPRVCVDFVRGGKLCLLAIEEAGRRGLVLLCFGW